MKRFIIDGLNLAYRAHFAHKELTTSTGRLSGCFYGFLVTLKALKSRNLDCHFYVAWDNEARHKKAVFPEYKANRQHFSIDEPVKDLKTVLKYLNIAQVEAIGEEADDVIASVAEKGEELTYIYSSDKDLLQLVRDGKIIGVRPGKKEKVYDEEEVKKKYNQKIPLISSKDRKSVV